MVSFIECFSYSSTVTEQHMFICACELFLLTFNSFILSQGHSGQWQAWMETVAFCFMAQLFSHPVPPTPPSLLCLCFKHLDFGCTNTLLYYKLTIAWGGCWWRGLYSPSPLSWWSGQQLGLCLSFAARASHWADISSALSAGATKGWGWGGGGDGRTRGGGGGGGAPQGRS